MQRCARTALANVSPRVLQAAPALAFSAQRMRGLRTVDANAWRACRAWTRRACGWRRHGLEKNSTGLLTLRKSVITFRPADVACGNE
jgi:hypothetical protein